MQAVCGIGRTNRPSPIHRLNPITRRSFCQAENNPVRVGWTKFDKLKNPTRGYPEVMCKNCEKLVGSALIKEVSDE